MLTEKLRYIVLYNDRLSFFCRSRPFVLDIFALLLHLSLSTMSSKQSENVNFKLNQSDSDSSLENFALTESPFITWKRKIDEISPEI